MVTITPPSSSKIHTTSKQKVMVDGPKHETTGRHTVVGVAINPTTRRTGGPITGGKLSDMKRVFDTHTGFRATLPDKVLDKYYCYYIQHMQ